MAYEDVVGMIRENSEHLGVSGGCSDDLILLAERTMGLRFPDTYRQFLRDFGSMGEVLGLLDESFEWRFRSDVVGHTLRMRSESLLPMYLIAVNETGDGEVLCLDGRVTPGRENPIVSFTPGMPSDEQTYERVFSDFDTLLSNYVANRMSFI